MADTTEPSNKELRDKLEAALKQVETLTQTNTNLQAQNLMPTLNERQRRVVMRELAEDKLDINEDNVTQVAEDLGYNLAPETTPPPATTNQNNDGQGNDNGQGQGDGQGEEDEDIMVSLSSMNAIDQATYNARKGNLSPDLETEMKKTNSREELRDLIRNKGHSSGLVHEWDDQ